MRICDHWSKDNPGPILSGQASICELYGPSWLHIEPLQLLNLTLIRMQTRMRLFTQMRIQIQLRKIMRIYMDTKHWYIFTAVFHFRIYFTYSDPAPGSAHSGPGFFSPLEIQNQGEAKSEPFQKGGRIRNKVLRPPAINSKVLKALSLTFVFCWRVLLLLASVLGEDPALSGLASSLDELPMVEPCVLEIKASKIYTGSMFRIRDVYPGSEFFHPVSWIRGQNIPDPDQHQRS